MASWVSPQSSTRFRAGKASETRPRLFRLAAIEAQAVAPDDGRQRTGNGIALGDPMGGDVAVKGIASWHVFENQCWEDARKWRLLGKSM